MAKQRRQRQAQKNKLNIIPQHGISTANDTTTPAASFKRNVLFLIAIMIGGASLFTILWRMLQEKKQTSEHAPSLTNPSTMQTQASEIQNFHKPALETATQQPAQKSKLKPPVNLLKDPTWHKLIHSFGIHYHEEDFTKAGVSKDRYAEVFYQMVLKIRGNIMYAANSEILKRVISRPGHSIIIRPSSVMKSALGIYNPITDTIYLRWDPNMSEAELRSVLRDEYSHAGMCFTTRPKVGNTIDCILYPDSLKLKRALDEGYKKVEDYQQEFFDYIKAKDKKPSKNLSELFDIMPSYEPQERRLLLTHTEHQKILTQPGVKSTVNGQLYIPQGTPIKGQRIQEECLMKWHKLNDKTIEYKTNWAMGNSPEALAKSFFIHMAQLQNSYRSGYSKFFNAGVGYELAEKASNVAILSPELKRFFFSSYCNLSSNFHGIEDYCDHPSVAP